MTMNRRGTRSTRAAMVARERLDERGALELSDRELLAILLGAAPPGAVDALIDDTQGVHALPRHTMGDLQQVKGLGTARAAVVVAAVELGRRTLLRPPGERRRLGAPREVARELLPRYGALPVEHFGIVLLDTKHRVLKTILLSKGTLDASLVHPREVFRTAAAHRAAAIILFHNHPSGDPSPSSDDAALTARLVEAGNIMGIEVVDHLVLADNGYYSFKEGGRL